MSEKQDCPLIKLECLEYDCRYYHPQDKEKCKYAEMKAFRKLAAAGKRIKVAK